MIVDKPLLGEDTYLRPEFADGLVYLGLYNEGDGKVVADLSGNENTGSFEGDTVWTSGGYGPALSFDGDGDIVNCGNKTILDTPVNNDTLTIVAGINANSWPTGGGDFWGIVTKGDAFAEMNWQFQYAGGTTALTFSWVDSGDAFRTVFAAQSITPTINQEHIIAVTVKPSDQRLYLDGRQVSTGSTANPLFYTGHSVRLGVLRDDFKAAAGSFDGTISFVYIYNRVLIASEILQLYLDPFWGLKNG